MVRGLIPICPFLFLFLGLLRAPTRNSPERVRDTIWTFPEKTPGKHPVWKPPGLASLSLLFVCKRELTAFLAELTEFAVELSEFSLPKQHSRNSIPPVSYVWGQKVYVEKVYLFFLSLRK